MSTEQNRTGPQHPDGWETFEKQVTADYADSFEQNRRAQKDRRDRQILQNVIAGNDPDHVEIWENLSTHEPDEFEHGARSATNDFLENVFRKPRLHSLARQLGYLSGWEDLIRAGKVEISGEYLKDIGGAE